MKGTLEVGKRADIAVWDGQPVCYFDGRPEELKCEMTILDGKVVYKR
jgi:predicted amidohydrolase YtcJ